MTNSEYREKYPIGTRIKYIGGKYDVTNDAGKTGKIVGYLYGRDDPLIFLPESNHTSECSSQECPVSWWACWSHLEILSPMKNQQLLFDFTY